MSERPAPKVCMRYNPWGKSLDDDTVLSYLTAAARNMEEQIERWIKCNCAHPDSTHHAVPSQDAAYGLVMLDPTNPRTQTTIKERIFALILLGDEETATNYLSNAAAKADAADRHRDHVNDNGQLVHSANYCLGDDDFAWGSSARLKSAIAAGSGLNENQDRELADIALKIVMPHVHSERARWIEGRRRNGSHGWFNDANQPGEEYLDILDLNSGLWATASS